MNAQTLATAMSVEHAETIVRAAPAMRLIDEHLARHDATMRQAAANAKSMRFADRLAFAGVTAADLEGTTVIDAADREKRVEAFWSDHDRGTDLQGLIDAIELMEAAQAQTFVADNHDAAVREYAAAGERVIYAAKQIRWAERRASRGTN